MVAIEHRVKSTPATTATATTTIEITSSSNNNISSQIVENSSSSSNNNNINNNNNISNSDLEIINLPSANLTPVTPTSPTTASIATTVSTTTTNSVDKLESSGALKMSSKVANVVESKEKPNEKPKLQTQRSVDIKIVAKSQELTKKGFKLDLKKSQDSQDELSLKSPKSPVSG